MSTLTIHVLKVAETDLVSVDGQLATVIETDPQRSHIVVLRTGLPADWHIFTNRLLVPLESFAENGFEVVKRAAMDEGWEMTIVNAPNGLRGAFLTSLYTTSFDYRPIDVEVVLASGDQRLTLSTVGPDYPEVFARFSRQVELARQGCDESSEKWAEYEANGFAGAVRLPYGS
jgi:hypothetical protein